MSDSTAVNKGPLCPFCRGTGELMKEPFCPHCGGSGHVRGSKKSKLTQTQQDALHCVLTRLNPDDPGNTASDEIKAHLRAMRPFLDSWVIPYLEAVQPNAPRWLVEEVKRDANNMRARRTRLS